MTALREAAQQALEALEQRLPLKGQAAIIDELNNLRAALAQQAEPVEPVDAHTTTLRNLLECCLSWEPDACVLGNVTARQAVAALRAALAQQDEPVAADALTEPKSGDKWRVEWWNESCRMMLPAHAKLDSFAAYKNGTIQFTIKRTAA